MVSNFYKPKYQKTKLCRDLNCINQKLIVYNLNQTKIDIILIWYIIFFFFDEFFNLLIIVTRIYIQSYF